jgi:hypothetical protein
MVEGWTEDMTQPTKSGWYALWNCADPDTWGSVAYWDGSKWRNISLNPTMCATFRSEKSFATEEEAQNWLSQFENYFS